jgi:hypothetical protein
MIDDINRTLWVTGNKPHAKQAGILAALLPRLILGQLWLPEAPQAGFRS